MDKQSGYDQKAFLQIRLHELLSSIDKHNICPLFYDYNLKTYSYQVIFQDLVSVFQTIYSKLTPEEKIKGREMRDKINQIISTPVYTKAGQPYKRVTMFNAYVWNQLKDDLFNFRCLLEEFMDLHGFNPSKADPRASILGM